MNSATPFRGDPFAPRPCRLADRVLARAFGASLDDQLAAGRPPESSRMLAARARLIVSLRSRQAAAGCWENLLRVARRGRNRREAVCPARPVRAADIAAAEPAIRELVRRLRTPLPVSARGVAMASVLLTDGTGPVYSRRSRLSLAAALDSAITQLDPALPLMPQQG